MAYNPNKWGPETTQKSYEFLMEGATCVAVPISLLEHALTSPSQELSDPVVAPVQSKVRGRIVTVNKTVLAAEQTALTYTLLFPSSFWTPALQKARNGGLCYTDFYAKYLCPSDPKFNQAFIYPDSLLDPPVETGDFVTNTTSTEILTEQTTLHTTKREILWAVGAVKVADQTNALNAIAFDQADCVGCSADVFTGLIAGGVPTALASPAAQITDDRYASVTAAVTGIPADSIITDVYSSGDVRLASFSDAVLATGTVGGVAASFDDGVTWALDTNITAPMFGVDKFNDTYIAVGGTGVGIGLIYSSTNGLDWTAVTGAALAGTSALNRITVDAKANAFYTGGEAAFFLKGTLSGGAIALSAITLPGSPGVISAIGVLGQDHVMVGGAVGYLQESFDGGASWTSVAFTSSAAVTGVAGNCWRTVIVAGAKIYERSILTDQAVKVLVPNVTITGDYTDLAAAPGDFNYFAAVTDDGEIVFVAPFYPNS